MGLQIPGYTIAGKLGEGGFAVVWAATGPGGAAVALEVANNPTELSRRRLGAEADAMEAIGPDFAPQVIERGALAGGRPYVAMERLFGRSLAAHLGAGPLPLARAGELAEVIAAAIAATAAAGYVHADLKPANIVVLAAPTAKVRLIDFGLARRIGSEDPGGETIAGTAAYMAPEQLRGEALTAATDVYGFGAVLFEMLAGRPPFVGDRPEIERGHLALRPPHPGSLRPLPESIAALCLACLAKVPAARPAIDGLGEAIAAAFGDVGEEPEAARSPTPAGMTTIAAARQPVVLLVIDGAPRAESEVRRLGGVVARRGGDRLVCGFTGGAGDPAGAALEGARAAVALGGRAALHLANLRVRGEPPSIYGREVERPETWMPDSETPSYLPLKGGGLNSAAAISTTETLEQILPAGGEDRRAIELVGRDAELEAAEASWRAVLETRTPGLFTALAGRGLGKSRLAAELAARLESDAAVTLGRGGGDDADLVARLSALRGGTAEPAAVIVDDLHLGSDALLDAVERAALDAVDTPLWIAACADPALLTRRRQWGLRAARAASVELGPLAREPARELAAALLRPAESPPAATLDRLVDWAGANPFYLRELARSLERAGVIRRRGASHYVATAALDALSALPVGQWLATRELDELPEELAACARVCAVLGPTFHRDELAHVLDAATRDGAAASAIDVDVGLAELAERGIIRGGPCWELRHRTLATGLADLLADADRRRLHRFALEYWIDRDDRDAALEARARHARACGEVELAAQSWAALAGRAREDHRYEAADRYYTSALDAGSADAHLYIRRGAVRIATYRLDDAIADLETAYERATSAAEQLEAALELATALDFAERPADSARWTERARELGDGGDPRARARLALSGARVLYRRHRWDEAVAALENAVDLAAAAGDPETRIAGLLILATGLVIAGRPGDAADRFDEVIELCRATGDRVHLAIAYSQRPWLWSARDTPDRGVGPAARRRHRPRRRPAADRAGRDPQPRRDVALVGRSRRGASPGRARLRAADPLRRGAGPRRRAAAGAGADRGRRPRGRPGFAGLDRRERQRRARRDPRAVDRNGRVGARRLARRVLGSA